MSELDRRDFLKIVGLSAGAAATTGCGELEDKLIPYEAAGWYMDHLPDATLAAYPGIGHLPMEEAPERSAADLQQWLARTLSSRDTPQDGTGV